MWFSPIKYVLVTDLWPCCSVLREKMESQLEKEARFCQLMAHSSHDSAIDTDSLEWETEVVEFEKDRVRLRLKLKSGTANRM